jgi:hypothetical protein
MHWEEGYLPFHAKTRLGPGAGPDGVNATFPKAPELVERRQLVVR